MEGTVFHRKVELRLRIRETGVNKLWLLPVVKNARHTNLLALWETPDRVSSEDNRGATRNDVRGALATHRIPSAQVHALTDISAQP